MASQKTLSWCEVAAKTCPPLPQKKPKQSQKTTQIDVATKNALAFELVRKREECEKRINEMRQAVDFKKVTDPKHPEYGSIIRFKENVGAKYAYMYIGCYHDSQHLTILENKTNVMLASRANAFYAVEYDPNDVNYMIVQAVYKYKEKYYLIPGSFSMEGNSDPDKEWEFIEKVNPTKVTYLDEMICRLVCPGFLDSY